MKSGQDRCRTSLVSIINRGRAGGNLNPCFLKENIHPYVQEVACAILHGWDHFRARSWRDCKSKTAGHTASPYWTTRRASADLRQEQFYNMGKQQQGEEGCLCENEADICSPQRKWLFNISSGLKPWELCTSRNNLPEENTQHNLVCMLQGNWCSPQLLKVGLTAQIQTEC